MTHITLPRETVQHIIEILPEHATFTKDQLRTALAAPAAQKVEPDYCTDPDNCRRCKTHPNHRGDMEHAGIGRRPVAPAAQKVASKVVTEGGKWQPAAREPLTQKQVVDGFCKLNHNTQYVSVFDAGVRFAEQHHGIGTQRDGV